MRTAATLLAFAAGASAEASHFEVLGYLENWLDVNWWDDNMPGNCLMGCFDRKTYLQKAHPYSALNYGFTLVTQHPNPDQGECKEKPGAGGSAGPCPVWDGNGIWMADSSKQGAAAIKADSIEEFTPGMVSILDAGRMAKQHPDGPKRFKIALGGWSDWARIGSVANAKKLAHLMSELVLAVFADGVDLDFEHFAEFDQIPGSNETEAFNALILNLRAEFNGLEARWAAAATARAAAMQKDYDALEDWQKEGAKAYYMTTIAYLKEVAANDAPHFEISWTTRFNAFLPKDDNMNYVLPGSRHPAGFATDYEGDKIFPVSGEAIDTVNIMAYDQDPGMGLNLTTILLNFNAYGKVPTEKLSMGFEPFSTEVVKSDEAWVHWMRANNIGGGFVWAVEEGADCEAEAAMLNRVMQPTWRFGKAPTFTKCNANGLTH